MERGPSDSERVLGFVQDCRDVHVAPYPVGTRVIQEHTGLSMYRVRTGVDAEKISWWLLQGEPTVLGTRPCPTDEDGYCLECGGEGPGVLDRVEIIGRHYPRCSYAVDGIDVTEGIAPAEPPVFEVVRRV